VIERFHLLSEMSCKEHDVGEAMTRSLIEDNVKEAQSWCDLEQGLRHVGGQRSEPSALAADEKRSLFDAGHLSPSSSVFAPIRQAAWTPGDRAARREWYQPGMKRGKGVD
jgi:hypothetical protein